MPDQSGRVQARAQKAVEELTRPRFHEPCGTTHVPGPCPPGRTLSPFTLWQEARTMADAYDEQDAIWHRLMTQHGLNKGSIAAYLLGHCILAKHGPHVRCEDCPCRHCATEKSDPDGDHSCPCPYSDNECPNHPWARLSLEVEDA